ncbi:hypothetical protein [Pedobacter sp. L105]|uniref:hypothetical protein n=1 Tax=Pedobacter sp. L105 TaxID=1641871 RepID=UPI00131BD0CE|nr:hypothetical protein [Pedobacter sp. L105]
MQYRIVEEFSDAKTGRKYRPDDEVVFSEERAEEILKVGLLIQLVPQDTEKQVKKSK